MSSSAKKIPPSLHLIEKTPIGQGGMANIYHAKQGSLEREVVIKRIKTELVSHHNVLQRFEREAKASSKLIHQNLAHVYDYVTTDGAPYIVMEYIEGIDVADMLARRGVVPVPVALAIMLGVTRALDYIHSYQLIHRDIKPENIRLSSRGEVKLMDFGIALQAEDAKLTLPEIIIGSPHYLSPEQILGEDIDHRSDLFSLGITLYELITGTRPFDVSDPNNHSALFKSIRSGKYVSPRKRNSQIPFWVSHLIGRLLEVDKRKRFQSAREIHLKIRRYLGIEDERAYLRQYLVHESFTKTKDNESTDAPKLTGRFSWKRWGTYTLFLILGSGLGLFLQSELSRSKENAPSFCPAPPDLASSWNKRDYQRIRISIESAGYLASSFPILRNAQLTDSLKTQLLSQYRAFTSREKLAIRLINEAKTSSILFSRKSILWPKLPPCN